MAQIGNCYYSDNDQINSIKIPAAGILPVVRRSFNRWPIPAQGRDGAIGRQNCVYAYCTVPALSRDLVSRRIQLSFV